MAKRLSHEIIELNGLDTFVKAKIDAFGIEKVLLSFVKFDKTTKKSIQSVDVYVSFEEMKVLCNDILTGRIALLAKEELKKGAAYPAAVWSSMGGTDADACKKRGLRTDGKAMSRVLELCPGSRQPFVFQIKQGMGEVNSKGLIVPKFGNSPEVRILVPVNAEKLKAFALMINSFIDSYFTYQFLSGGYDYEYESK